jgi:hypothetical protein
MDTPDEARAMGLRGRAAVSAEFARRKQAADFERLLRELVPGTSAERHWGRRTAAA